MKAISVLKCFACAGGLGGAAPPARAAQSFGEVFKLFEITINAISVLKSLVPKNLEHLYNYESNECSKIICMRGESGGRSAPSKSGAEFRRSFYCFLIYRLMQ